MVKYTGGEKTMKCFVVDPITNWLLEAKIIKVRTSHSIFRPNSVEVIVVYNYTERQKEYRRDIIPQENVFDNFNDARECMQKSLVQ